MWNILPHEGYHASMPLPSSRARVIPLLLLSSLLVPCPVALATERTVSELHAALGRLDEEKERAHRRRDRKAEKRLDREMKETLWQLKRARARQEIATEASDDADVEEARPAPAPAAPGRKLPLLSEVLRQKAEREGRVAAPGAALQDPKTLFPGRTEMGSTPALQDPATLFPGRTAPAPASGESVAEPVMTGDPVRDQEATLQQLEQVVAKLRSDLLEQERAFASCTPEEQEFLRPMYETSRRQAAQAIASAEMNREEARRSLKEYHDAVDENRQLRDQILREREEERRRDAGR